MTRNPPRRLAVIAVALAGLAFTAGCSTSTPEEPAENNMSNLVDTYNAMEINEATPTPTPEPSVAPPPADPGADFQTTDQTFDDAAAAGMTSKLPPANAAEPAQEQKKQ